MGFEPTTSCLQGKRSSVKLRARTKKYKSYPAESSRNRTDYRPVIGRTLCQWAMDSVLKKAELHSRATLRLLSAIGFEPMAFSL